MKKTYYLTLFIIFFVSLIPESKAIIMPIPLSISGKDSAFLNKNEIKRTPSLIKKMGVKKARTLGKTAKVMGFMFLGLLLLAVLAPFQSRLAIIAVALLVGLLALIFALVGVAAAKEPKEKEESKKGLLWVVGVIVGVILIALIAISKIGFA
jgi:FtsH-binding integral membrane protein